MKNIEIVYLNTAHQVLIEKLEKEVKAFMYFATEDEGVGKYQDFLNLLDSVYLYSNNFHETSIKNNVDDGVMAEFIFLIPNMIFYTTIGFLTALKNNENKKMLEAYLLDIGDCCESMTGELADVLIDETQKRKLREDILETETLQN